MPMNVLQKKKYKDTQEQASSECAFVVASSENDEEVREANGWYIEQVQQMMRTDICDAWLTDSGASAHITFQKDWFAEFRQIEGDTVSLGDDGVCAIEGVGKIRVKKLVNGTWQDGTIENVLFVPSVKKNLFSVGVCTMKRYSVQRLQCKGRTRWTNHGDRGKTVESDFPHGFFLSRPKKEANVSVTNKNMARATRAYKSTLV